MASPPYNHNTPYSAISPPYPSNAQLPPPIKRRQSDMPTGALPASKRRKASMLSTTSSSHPLRQTSFPPETLRDTPAYSRSPSIDTTSLISGVSGLTKRGKKRVRKSKGRERDDDSASVAGGKAKSTASGHSAPVGKGGKRGTKRKAEDEEEEEDDGPGMELQVVERSKQEEEKEKQQRAMLTQAFNDDQKARYGLWRAAKLQDKGVKTLMNQVLSQSVGPGVVLGMKGIAKIYAGEIIEGARKVQEEWAKIDEEKIQEQTGLPRPEGMRFNRNLEPEHLREAYRRHRLAKEGGLTGQLDLWQLQNHSGVERFGTKTGGKRIFK